MLATLLACAAAPTPTPTPPSTCGDGVLDARELCDSPPLACTELGSSWAAGTATCRSDCSGYVVDTCQPRDDTADWEVVKPQRRDPRFEGARCNDGSAAAFYVRPSPTGTDDWVIHLEGGGYCDDTSSACDERGATLVTTPAADDRALRQAYDQGVMSPDAALNPDFWQANHVVVQYCTSDLFAGTEREPIEVSGAPEGWSFDGRSGLAATLAVLRQRFGLVDGTSSVLFTGTSAGGWGVSNTLDLVVDALPESTATGRLRAVIDAGWHPFWDEPAWRLEGVDAADEDVYAEAMALWQGRAHPDCDAAWHDCVMPPRAWPFHEVPVLVQQNTRDIGHLVPHGIDPDDEAAVAAWEDNLLDSLEPVDWLFAPSVTEAGGWHPHGLLMEDIGFGFCPGDPDTCADGTSFREVLGAFWRGEPARRLVF